jgi:hypothetical protein
MTVGLLHVIKNKCLALPTFLKFNSIIFITYTEVDRFAFLCLLLHHTDGTDGSISTTRTTQGKFSIGNNKSTSDNCMKFVL